MKKYLLILSLGLVMASCTSNNVQEKKTEEISKKPQTLEQQQIEYEKLKSENEKLKIEVDELNKKVQKAEGFDTEK